MFKSDQMDSVIPQYDFQLKLIGSSVRSCRPCSSCLFRKIFVHPHSVASRERYCGIALSKGNFVGVGVGVGGHSHLRAALLPFSLATSKL